MAEIATVYEVAEHRGTPTLFSRKAILRPKTVKWIEEKNPDVFASGVTACNYGSTATRELCVFTPAEVWSKYIEAKAEHVEQVEAELAKMRVQLTEARAELAALGK